MTGQRKIVHIANRFGHSASYDKVLDIETAYAQKAQKTIETILPLKPDKFDQVYYLINKKLLKTFRNRNTRKRCKICAKLTMKTQE